MGAGMYCVQHVLSSALFARSAWCSVMRVFAVFCGDRVRKGGLPVVSRGECTAQLNYTSIKVRVALALGCH